MCECDGIEESVSRSQGLQVRVGETALAGAGIWRLGKVMHSSLLWYRLSQSLTIQYCHVVSNRLTILPSSDRTRTVFKYLKVNF
jgi:hypothetical protein